MYQAAVIGLGGVGSFALNALSKCGGKFLGIERFQIGHTFGSSHGKTRLYRRAYFEDERYVPWIEMSLETFKALGDRFNERLLQECGMLLMGIQQQQTDVQLPPLLQAGYDTAQKHGIHTEIIRDLPDRFPQFRQYDGMVGLLEPGGGFVRPELSMRLAMREATEQQTNNIDVMEETTVIDWTDCGSFFDLHLQTKDGENLAVQTERIVISAGPWTSELLPEWSKKLKVIRQLQTWMDLSTFDDESCRQSHHYKELPGWVMDVPNSSTKPLYGIPSDDEDWLVKIGIHGREDVVTNPSIPTPVSSEETREMMAAANDSMAVAPRVADRQQYVIQPCFYTMTADSHFCIGSPRPRVFAIGGLSGHGFKMAPALGQMMADFATTGHLSSSWQLEFCSPSRL